MKTLTLLSLAGACATATLVIAPPHASPAVVDPADFAHPLQNPYFPLRPGTVTTLRGVDDGERLREQVIVTHRTKAIQGVRTRVVLDVVRRTNGVLAERTF